MGIAFQRYNTKTMINHARTLLLNQPGKNYMPGTLGEEYTPPDYTPVNVPSYIALPRKILFGSNPDKVFLNFRAAELMGLVHATELSEFVYAFDPRETYTANNGVDFFSAPSFVALNKTSGYNSAKIFLGGRTRADNSRGRSFRDYTIQLVEENGNTKAAINSSISTDSAIESVEFANGTNGLSAPVAIVGSELTAQFLDSTLISAAKLALENIDGFVLQEDYNKIDIEIGTTLPFSFPPALPLIGDNSSVIAQWQLQTYARPSDAISFCLPKLETLGEPLFLELFGVRNDVQPYATFKNIWFDHPMPVYRLAAFVLAIIYRTEENRG